MTVGHLPVMPDAVARELITDPDGTYVDATVGAGGHAAVILERLSDKGELIGCDRDPAGAERARRALSSHGRRVTVVTADYRNLARVLAELGRARISGVLFDLGLSSIQLDDPERGFAYRFDGPLDLRFDQSRGTSAAQWLAVASREEIAAAIWTYGEDRNANRIARVIERARDEAPITTTGELAQLLERVSGRSGAARGRTAARVFQALRIVVNDELSAIPLGLAAAIEHLDHDGRLVVIAYHSLEDRLVKEHLREASRECRCARAVHGCICGANPSGRLVYRRVLKPDADEIARNPRAKAARMRVFARVRDRRNGAGA